MDSGNSESLQSSSDDHESSSTGAAADHSSFFLPPFSSSSSTFYGGSTNLSSSSSATYLNFVNNFISDDILHQTHLLHPPPPPQPPPPQPPSSSRNPRKRTRASRRAPTTVLTTDTSNFRAMVQEFTGVPASPFSHPFSSTTRRFDIFRSPSDQPLNFNPFRPIPPKPDNQPLMPSSSSSFLNQYNHTSTSTNFQSLPDLPLPQSHHQVSTFQSLLSHQHHNHQTIISSLHDLDSINLGALQQNKNHNPTADDDHQLMMMRQFSEFDRRTEKGQDSSSSVPIKGSSGTPTTTTTTTTTTATTTVDPWICPTDSNN